MKYLLIFMSLLFMTPIFAQKNHNSDRSKIKERIEARKIAFLSDKLELTPTLAQQFWPIYNEYEDAIHAVRKNCRQFVNDEKGEVSADVTLSKLVEHEEKQLEIKKKYIAQFKDLIGSKKTLDLLKFDREFKEKMIKDLRHRKNADEEN